MATLTKTVVVPEWDAQKVFLYTPSTQLAALGQPVVNPEFTVDMAALTKPGLFNNTPNPNACIIDGVDLYIAATNASQAIVKLPGYLQNPSAAIANAFLIDSSLNDYVGLAMNSDGSLYAAAGSFDNNQIVRYPGARTATGVVAPTPLPLTDGTTAYFGDLTFDSAGNLWAADYLNNRLVVLAKSGLSGLPLTWLALENPIQGAALATANTYPGTPALPAFAKTVSTLFTSPEGVDFDSFGASANLWVANNNDGDNPIGTITTNTTLVQITSGMLNSLRTQLADDARNNRSVTADTFIANTDFKIYQVPNYPASAGSTQRPQFGGLQVDKSTGWLYVNDETNDSVSGWVRAYLPSALATITNNPADTSSRTLALALPAGKDTGNQAGNGGIALINLGAYVPDTASDAGFEPDSSATSVWWESPNIVPTIATGLQTTLPVPYIDPSTGDAAVLGGLIRNIYVQVNNFGPTETTGLEQLRLYWAKGSSTLNWPQPWDGADPAIGNIIPGPKDPVQSPTILQIPKIPGSTGGTVSFTIVGPIAWTTPNPADFGGDGHFCLLARVITPNTNYAENTPVIAADPSILTYAGMSFPEASGQPSNLNSNVISNARIGWRNIHILETEPGGGGGNTGPAIRRRPPSVVATNHGDRPLHLRIGFELLDSERWVVAAPPSPLVVSATGKSLEILERSALGTMERHHPKWWEEVIEIAEEIIDFLEGFWNPNRGRRELLDFSTGIEGVHLAPGENLTFEVHYGDTAAHNYAIRAMAFAKEAGGERLIGGQTFVYGKVKGLTGQK